MCVGCCGVICMHMFMQMSGVVCMFAYVYTCVCMGNVVCVHVYGWMMRCACASVYVYVPMVAIFCEKQKGSSI